MNETEMSQLLINVYPGTELMAMPDMYTMDRMVVRDGSLIGFAEMKGRTFPHDKYRTTMVDAVKVYACIEHEANFGVPAHIFFGFADGVMLGFRPAVYAMQHGFTHLELSTPRSSSISANAGKTRPVALIPVKALDEFGAVPGFTPSPRVTPPPRPQTPDPALTPTWTQGPGMTVERWRARIAEQFGWDLHRNPHGHPLVWCAGIQPTTVTGWVDVAFRDSSTPDEAIPVAMVEWAAALEHERLFPGTEAWLTFGYADGNVLAIRPANYTGPVRASLRDRPGLPGHLAALVPADAFTRL